ncbi:C2 domain containing protein [Trichuris trichiura]|uniref:C2 domain containing protein n=1 Tax=Trichuris trichiura TaxID=36087 RepID=A0A077ZA27_TRITR|nr:C2 domain containing protein [Trichuris trichiura]
MDHCLISKIVTGSVSFSNPKRGQSNNCRSKGNNTYQVDGRRAFSLEPIVHRNLDAPTGNRLKKQLLHVRWSHYDTMKTSGDPVSQSGQGARLLVALIYLPEACNSSVITWLVQADGEIEKRSTAVKYGSISPTYNEAFTFYVEPEDIFSTSLVLAISNANAASSDDELGHVILGSRANEFGKSHWRQMVMYANRRIVKWHPLSLKW